MSKDWNLNHIGLMVTNRNTVLNFFQTIGLGVSVGPQPLLPYEEGNGELTYFQKLEGDPITHKYKTGGAHNFRDGNSQIGDCQLEVYPMKPGPGMFISEYLERKGPGINHIAFNTNNIIEDTEFLVSKGCELVFKATVNGETVENYLDTRRYGDLMISLRPPMGNWEKTWKENNLAHPLVSDWKFKGLGIAVSDIESASNYYRDLNFSETTSLLENKSLNTKYQQFNIGGVLFELIEPLTTESIYQDSLKLRGDGVAEIIFAVDDLNMEVKKLQSKGVNLMSPEDSINQNFASFDTRGEGNLITRLIKEIE